MLQRLPTTLTHVQAGNTSESLLSEICQIIYSLYRAKEPIKKLYSNIINSINLWIYKFKKIAKHLNRLDYYLIL